MPKTYNDLYLATRTALKSAGVEAYALEARLLVAYAVGKTKEEFVRDLRLYTSDENEQKIAALLQRYRDMGCRRLVALRGDLPSGMGHPGEFRYATDLADRTGAPVWLHPGDEPVWNLTHPDRMWDQDLEDGQEFTVGPVTLQVLHTPGHSPGSVSLYSPTLGCVFTGDTLFNGGPGATGRSFSSRPLIEESIRARLFALPDDTVVHTGHGDDTTIGAEAEALGR